MLQSSALITLLDELAADGLLSADGRAHTRMKRHDEVVDEEGGARSAWRRGVSPLPWQHVRSHEGSIAGGEGFVALDLQ